MNHDASPVRRTLLLGVVVLAVAGALVVLRRPLLMSAPRCFSWQWQGCLTTENGVVLVTLLTVPLSLLVVWALAWWRRAVGFTAAWRTSLAEVGMVHGTVPFVWMTLMPGENAGLVDGRLSLVPLRDLLTMGPLGVVANLLIFAALGFFAPMRFTALTSAVRVFVLGAGCSILVETAQYVLRLDRVSSVDDVLLNAAGAALAALASRRWWRVAAEKHPAPDPR